MQAYFKIRIENGDFWTEDDSEMKFTDISSIIDAVDAFISDTEDAAILDCLPEPYGYDDIEIVYFDTKGIQTVYLYPDFISDFDQGDELSIGG